MLSNRCLTFLIMLPCLIAADESDEDGFPVATPMLTIIAVIFGSFLATLGFASIAYIILRFIKRIFSEPQYVFDDSPTDKSAGEHHPEPIDFNFQWSSLNQIRPNFNVSHMFSSVKQSMADLGASLVPSNWSRVQRVYDPSNGVNEKPNKPV